MTPPKKSTATLDATTNFFQRGKKSTIPQRVVTGKKAITPTVAPKIIKDNETEEPESDHIDDAEFSDELESQHSEQEEEEEDHEDHSLLSDEIQSDYDDVSDSAADLQKAEKTTKLKESISSLNKTTEIAETKPKKKAATTRSKKAEKKSDYVVPYVGDIYAGFHQADISETEKALRQFDLALKYGPSTDLTRLERWERAFELGLNPPQDVKDTLVAHMTLNTPLFEGRV
ncbi:hypothetical protein BGX26_005314 [Mortierella sp. AD094]|nr:hypothetical protein BGX26_005314 [Mortierella sp. AD094]